jgi:hypothetical protein
MTLHKEDKTTHDARHRLNNMILEDEENISSAPDYNYPDPPP